MPYKYNPFTKKLDYYPDVPVKASGTEVSTGTDDAKFVTPKALKDSNLWLELQVFN